MTFLIVQELFLIFFIHRGGEPIDLGRGFLGRAVEGIAGASRIVATARRGADFGVGFQ